ncbi:MAG TPA: hypothetical protein VK335_19525 [Bryobacteraceae bacterium]|nr:hypothetical protein [Bryobacteraceae bacterium]
MKAKKAIKRLSKVESILANVIDQFSASDNGLRELLDSAKTSIVRAKKSVGLQESSKAAKKPPSRADKSQRARLSAEGRKNISIAAKKRWALAKRKGMNAVTGRKLKKTA